jgi:Domain of unknown function (DUF4386)
MDSYEKTPGLLGAAFLVVILTSALSGSLLNFVVGTGNVFDILTNISENLPLMRISILVELLTSIGIIILAALLYLVLNKQNKIIALAALGLWLAEAITLAVSKIGAFALMPLSLDFVMAGAMEHSFYLTLGKFLYYGVDRQGYNIHMFFYCVGGILWYYLFYKSKYIPRVISLFGLIAVCVSFVGIVFNIFGYDVPIYVFLPILPFELTIGVWLIVKGTKLTFKGKKNE